jgi:hypothetical protein
LDLVPFEFWLTSKFKMSIILLEKVVVVDINN